MCGFAGLWGPPRPADDAEALVRRMRDTLVSRGPDDAGFWADPRAGVALGHRRLSIVDLSSEGHQPMASSSGRYVIAYNGEVYNFGEIRRELTSQGLAPEWRGGSDTEVVLAAIEAWGLEAALTRFVGMFAFALWDGERRVVHLVRDRIGIKPLVYARAGSDLVFGSSLRALRVHPAFDRGIDLSALVAFLRFNYVPSPHTIHRNARKVEPGSILTFRAPNEEPSERRYWDASEVLTARRAAPIEDEAEALDRLEATLRSAIRLRMIADVPIGAFLSGGIDSSLVVALMQEVSDRPVRTFSIGNTRLDYDESRAASAVATHLGTEHTELIVGAEDALAAVSKMSRFYDEPFADASQLPTFLVSELARRDVTVALSGDGGDELFGGYNRHVWGPFAWSAMRRVPFAVRGAVAGAVSRRGDAERVNELLAGRVPFRLPGDKLEKLARALPSPTAADFYRVLQSQWDDPAALVVGGPDEARRRSRAAPSRDLAEQMMFGDLVGYLPDDILTKVDRASMAVSLEARVPLLDHRVVELAWRMPRRMKIRRSVGKLPLRELLGRRVPAELWDRPKMGFGVPVSDWLRGPLFEWGDALLSPSRLREQGIFEVSRLRKAWEAHRAGSGSSHAYALYGVLAFQAWHDDLVAGVEAGS